MNEIKVIVLDEENFLLVLLSSQNRKAVREKLSVFNPEGSRVLSTTAIFYLEQQGWRPQSPRWPIAMAYPRP